MADSKTPILDSLIESGDITMDGHTYVGHASDGVEVQIGVDYKPEFAELYLRDYPSPDTW